LAHSLVLAAIVIAGLGTFFAIKSQFRFQPLYIGNNKLSITVARTQAERAHGLCCRDRLPADQAMLFAYSQPGNYQLWMKDTRIPLDMYWIDSSKKIVHIEHSVQPSSYPQTFGADVPVAYMLETNAGYAKSHNVTVGNQVRF